jgi:thiamine-monophosphate kinase
VNPFTRSRARSVASLGEARLIAAIREWLGRANPPPPFGIGDDCAVIRDRRGVRLMTVDPVVHGRHFDDDAAPGEVGAKLLKRNLSDIAAMGGRPGPAVVALALDPSVSTAWLGGFYRGLAACAARFGVPIAGGDVTEAPGVLVATLTLLGNAPGRVLSRTGARRGDWIYVTGSLGRSVATGHHLDFTPRLREGAWLARRPEVRSMMDVSDGLAKDLWALTPAGCVPDLDPGAVPRRAGSSLRQSLCDGEDYELAFALRSGAPAAIERAWRRAFPRVRLSRIGRFVPAGARAPALRLADYGGYEHLR